jgi:hypothetical protein
MNTEGDVEAGLMFVPRLLQQLICYTLFGEHCKPISLSFLLGLLTFFILVAAVNACLEPQAILERNRRDQNSVSH